MVVEYVEDKLGDRCCTGDEVRLEILGGDGAQHLAATSHWYRHQVGGHSEHGLWLIEDNCDALGSTYRGRMTGSFGDMATQSFYPPHHITMGEGGAVLSNSGKLKFVLHRTAANPYTHCAIGLFSAEADRRQDV